MSAAKRPTAETLEGIIEVEDIGNGGSEINLGGDSVADWANRVADSHRGEVKAVVMIEDRKYLEAQGLLTAYAGDCGYSSWTPGSGPSVYVYSDAHPATFSSVTERLEANRGCNAVVSLELIA